MIISDNGEPYEICEYDLLFLNGYEHQITINRKAGDTIVVSPDEIIVHMAERKSLADPSQSTPAETQIIPRTDSLIIIKQRTRLVIPQSPNAIEEMRIIIQNKSKTVH